MHIWLVNYKFKNKHLLQLLHMATWHVTYYTYTIIRDESNFSFCIIETKPELEAYSNFHFNIIVVTISMWLFKNWQKFYVKIDILGNKSKDKFIFIIYYLTFLSCPMQRSSSCRGFLLSTLDASHHCQPLHLLDHNQICTVSKQRQCYHDVRRLYSCLKCDNFEYKLHTYFTSSDCRGI